MPNFSHTLFLAVAPIALIALGTQFGDVHPRMLSVAWLLYMAFLLGTVVRRVQLDNRRRLLRHRSDFGLCSNCGYDLRGTNAACPECGWAVGTPEHGN